MEILKIKLVLILTSVFFLLYTPTIFAQNPTIPVVGSTSNFLLFTSVGAVTNSGTTSIYGGNVGTNGGGTISGFQTLQKQPFGLFEHTAETTQCASDLVVLYNDLMARSPNTETDGIYGGVIRTLTAGVYHSETAVSIVGNLTLDGQDNPDARFIIQTDGAFTMAAGTKIILINGTKAKNVFWKITGAASIATNTDAKGIFVSTGAISLGTNCMLDGSFLTTEGAISGAEGMTLASPFMLLRKSQTIYSGTIPDDLILIGNNNPIIRWESSLDSNFSNPVDINYYSLSLAGSCIGPLITTIYYRVVVLIDGSNVNSNIVKINVINAPIIPQMGAASDFVLFTSVGDVTNSGDSATNAFIGTNRGTINGFTNVTLLHVQDTQTINCANYLQELFDSLTNIPTTKNHIAAFGAGEILLPGVYFMDSAATIDGILTIDGTGSTNSIFIIKIKGALAFAAATKIILTNGASASNVFWVIDGGLDVGANSEARGNFICLAGGIALGNNTITEGRFLTMAGDITLENCTLSTTIIATSDQVIRSNTQPQNLNLIGKVDTIVKWQKSLDILFSHPIDIPNTTNATLSGTEIGNLTVLTYFRAVVTIGGKTIYSTSAKIAITQATVPGVVSSSQEFCSASQPNDLFLLGNSGLIIKWQSAINSDFTNPKDIPNTTNTLTGIAIGILSETTYYRAVIQNCTCPIQYSTPAKISIATFTTWNGTSWDHGIPSKSKTIFFAANYNATENITACSVTINNGANVTINAGVTLTITNELNSTGGFITFENNASLVQINDLAVNIGNITYKRESAPVINSDYSYWSSPIEDQTLLLAFSKSPSGRIYSYDSFSNPENWKREAIETVMLVGKGYIAQGPQSNSDISYRYETSYFGKPNNGILEIPLGPIQTSNLIGNPYPSALNADMFIQINANSFDGTIYFWTHASAIRLAAEVSNPGSGIYAYSSDDYASYNLSGGVAANSENRQPSGKVAAGQSFFITSTATNTNAIFNNGMRSVGGASGINNSQFFKSNTTGIKTVTNLEKNRLWLNLSNNQGAFKQMLIAYVSGASNGYDSGHDGESLDANRYLDFYSINSNKNLAIQGRALPFDDQDEVELGFKTTINSEFKIAIDHSDGLFINQDVVLKDKLKESSHDLKSGDYHFTTEAGTFNDRFVIVYTNKNLDTKDFSSINNSVLVATKNKQITIKSAVEAIDKVFIYDLFGRQVYQKININNTELFISTLATSQQVLIVKTVLQNEKITRTKILY